MGCVTGQVLMDRKWKRKEESRWLLDVMARSDHTAAGTQFINTGT